MFGHLQVRSSYSFQSSTITIESLCQNAARQNIQALALTDKNVLFGAIEFYQLCLKYQIKPIIGIDVDVLIDEQVSSVILLARNHQGYLDLCKLSTFIQFSGPVPFEQLQQYCNDCIVLCDSSNSLIAKSIQKKEYDLANKYMRLFKEVFQQNFYIVLHDHGLHMQQMTNQQLISLANNHQIMISCSNDVRYLQAIDAYALFLLENSTNETTLLFEDEPTHDQQYLKNELEMAQIFPQIYLENTSKIIDLCHCLMPKTIIQLPKYDSNIENSHEYLTQLCIVGLKKRRHGNVTEIDIERLKKELNVIEKMGFADYFLIVFDYIRFARKKGIIVGPGRGSAPGSLVAYVLGITNIDPIKYDLLFERFLNVERISMPDIDVDFQDNRRDEVIDYVIARYGQEHVSHIITFNTYGPKNTIKSFGKLLGIATPKLEILSKMIPNQTNQKKSIAQLMEESYQFKQFVQRDKYLSKIIYSLSIIEHLPKNKSIHAAGIVLNQTPLKECIPLTLSLSKQVLVQYTKDYIESIGLLKMDFLGVKNLTVIDLIIKEVKRLYQADIELTNIPFDDKKTYQLLAGGDTLGIFQLESKPMQNLLQEMQCDCFDDIVSAIALYRPGPMAFIPNYIARKKSQEKIVYDSQSLQPILQSTYGIFIYQEQIMQVASVVAGFSLAKADHLRKAISKKNHQIMKNLKDEFITGSIHNGYSREVAQKIYSSIEKFADYGFNKSHSVSYSIISYYQAYLKANYPLAFFSAILSNIQSSSEAIYRVIGECKKYGVKILPPSISKSTKYFKVEDGNIRYALSSIKGISHQMVEKIEAIRLEKFSDYNDFFIKINKLGLSKENLVSLIDAGALDEFNLSRATMKENIDEMERFATLYQKGIKDEPILKLVDDQQKKLLIFEKEALGLYFSNHPVILYKQQENLYNQVALANEFINQNIQFIIQFERVREIVDKKGQRMAFFTGIDETGEIEGVIFGSNYEHFNSQIRQGEIWKLNGLIQKKERLSFVVQSGQQLS